MIQLFSSLKWIGFVDFSTEPPPSLHHTAALSCYSDSHWAAAAAAAVVDVAFMPQWRRRNKPNNKWRKEQSKVESEAANYRQSGGKHK